jgi:hypothetical protein
MFNFVYIRFLLIVLLILGNTNQMVYANEQSSAPQGFVIWGVDTIVHTLIKNQHRLLKINELTDQSVVDFRNSMNKLGYQNVVERLNSYRKTNHLSDWLFYQLVRNVAQEIMPKSQDYNAYTLVKWYFLGNAGFDARVAIQDQQLYFYVHCDEAIQDVPFYEKDGKQYVCLNIHDFPGVKVIDKIAHEVPNYFENATQQFSYQIHQIPALSPESYDVKALKFTYKKKSYHFNLKVSHQMPEWFKNYPIVDYASYFNIPLNTITYNSLIPALKVYTSGKSVIEGVDYLMRFTREAFAYKNDQLQFGKEKRLAPELTLQYNYSDCDDRAALFFYLVKEIYNLPMIVLLYPEHLSIAVQVDAPNGVPIVYKNQKYFVCEPTPQAQDLQIGQINPKLAQQTFEIAYEYHP